LKDEPARSVITVRLHGNLRRFLPSGREVLKVSPKAAATVAALLAYLDMPQDEVASVGVNGRLAEPTQTLTPGDQVDIFAPVAGGDQEERRHRYL